MNRSAEQELRIEFERSLLALAKSFYMKTGMHMTEVNFNYSEHAGEYGMWYQDSAVIKAALFEDPAGVLTGVL